jgi:MFS family permease
MIFSVGYIAGVLPLSALAQRLPTGRACALYVVLWGIVVILTPLCKSFEGIMVQRFFLGFMESGVSPAFLSIMGMWYTKREQALRAPVIYSANGFVVVPLLLMAWGIVTVGPEADAWQNLFWLIGESAGRKLWLRSSVSVDRTMLTLVT